jgi:hypothetical protein
MSRTTMRYEREYSEDFLPRSSSAACAIARVHAEPYRTVKIIAQSSGRRCKSSFRTLYSCIESRAREVAREGDPRIELSGAGRPCRSKS